MAAGQAQGRRIDDPTMTTREEIRERGDDGQDHELSVASERSVTGIVLVRFDSEYASICEA